MKTTSAVDGRKRVVLEGVRPEIDGGRFPIKRTVNQTVVTEIDAFTDGHDVLSCFLLYRKEGADDWKRVSMKPLGNDRWRAEFPVWEIGRYQYTFTAGVDHFKSWRSELVRRVQAEDIAVALQVGATLLQELGTHTGGSDGAWLRSRGKALVGGQSQEERLQYALSEELAIVVARHPDLRLTTAYDKILTVVVDDERARFSTWYELFPRSCSPLPGRHGTFKDCEAVLPRIADMGFDVVYFPPIHPIGRINRKGRNNTLTPGPADVGSPWAIGAAEGGHKSTHPELGTLDDFRALVAKAGEYGIDIAMDIAFQCAPDHPYVQAHPSWFRWRPDGTVQYAENPPKKYQDIYPFNFESEDWQALWEELKSIFAFWIEQGVRIFRVDNPHTKPFPMWEWIITEIKKIEPRAIFLAEAFTRPKVMHRLAKLGYSQSYTYFTWRNTKLDLTEYMLELTGPGREYFRPNFWPNTPDILNEYLQFGGQAGFMNRLALAATLTANYGIYGPAYELMEAVPVKHGSEEYLDSEKYEIRQRDLDQAGGLRDFITQVNRIRKSSPALQQDWNLCFHPTDNDYLICYSKWNDKKTDIILVIVNMDPHHVQAGWVTLNLKVLDISDQHSFEVHDLLADTHYLWHGARNYVELDPREVPAHIFRLHSRVHTEEDFDYFIG